MTAVDVLILGDDVSALLLAGIAAAVGRSVCLVGAGTAPTARPLPLPDDRRWQALRAVLPSAEPEFWQVFGGARRRADSRALPIGPGREMRVAASGGWRSFVADAGEAWSEPGEWAAWAGALSAAADAAGLRRSPLPSALSVAGGILRRARIAGLPPARRALIVAVDTPAVAVEWPQAWPRTFSDDGGAWWAPCDRRTLNVAGAPRMPPGWDAVVPSSSAPPQLPWGVVDCRGLRIAAPPSAAGAGPTEWLDWLHRQMRWLGIGRRDVGKAARVAV